MTDGGGLEPKDSRNVTGMAHTPDGRWSDDAAEEGPDDSNGGELEPKDSRNVTGMATTDDGRWTGAAVRAGEEPRVPEPKSDPEDDE